MRIKHNKKSPKKKKNQGKEDMKKTANYTTVDTRLTLIIDRTAPKEMRQATNEILEKFKTKK